MNVKKKGKAREKGYYYLFILLTIIVLILSILIPLILIYQNQTGSCAHHIEESGGFSWILGRALGFSTLINITFTSIIGANTKKIAKIIKSYNWVKNFHCFNAFLTISVFFLHVGFLFASDPWGPMIFEGEYNHIPYPLFIIKLWTGIIFAVLMLASSFLFLYLKDVKKLKKFGYKNLIRLHDIMLISSVFLAVHIFLINIEIIILLWG